MGAFVQQSLDDVDVHLVAVSANCTVAVDIPMTVDEVIHIAVIPLAIQNHILYLEPSKQLQTMKNTWGQTFVYQLLLDFNTSNLLFGGSQKSAYLCNAFLPRRILRAFILPSRGQS